MQKRLKRATMLALQLTLATLQGFSFAPGERVGETISPAKPFSRLFICLQVWCYA